MNNTSKQGQKDVFIAIACAFLFAFGIWKVCNPDNGDPPSCYEQAAHNAASVEGDKPMTRGDVDRETDRIVNSCN